VVRVPGTCITTDSATTTTRIEDIGMSPEIITTQQRWPDSICIGTPGKGGEINLYFNSEDLAEAQKRIDNAVTARQYFLTKLAQGGTSA